MRWIPPIVGAAVITAEAGLSLVAQAAGQDAGGWIRDLTTAWGPVAALAWYLYYTTSVTFPRISQQHLDQLARLDQEHRRELHQAMDAWRVELKEDRRVLAEILQSVRAGE